MPSIRFPALGENKSGGRGAGRKVKAEQEHVSVQCKIQVDTILLLLLPLYQESQEKQCGKIDTEV